MAVKKLTLIKSLQCSCTGYDFGWSGGGAKTRVCGASQRAPQHIGYRLRQVANKIKNAAPLLIHFSNQNTRKMERESIRMRSAEELSKKEVNRLEKEGNDRDACSEESGFAGDDYLHNSQGFRKRRRGTRVVLVNQISPSTSVEESNGSASQDAWQLLSEDAVDDAKVSSLESPDDER
jgi:hypothetical protein